MNVEKSVVEPRPSYEYGDPLDVLEEECVEVIKEIVKARRFGADTPHPSSRLTPKQRLVNELGDLLCSVAVLMDDTFSPTDLADLIVALRKRREKLLTMYGQPVGPGVQLLRNALRELA